MAKSDATPAATGGDGQSQTPSGGDQMARKQTQTSTTQQIDFSTGLPVDNATPAATGATKTGSQQQQPQPSGGDDATPAATGAMFTQEQVESIINERLKSERKKFADYDELKAAADELKELQGQQETEEKQLAERLADERSQRTALEIELQEARIHNVVVSEAARMGLVDPSDAYHFVDVAALEFNEAGQPTNVKAQLEALKEAKPYLFSRKAVPQVEPANAARGGQPAKKTEAELYREYFGGGGGNFWQGGGLTVVEQE